MASKTKIYAVEKDFDMDFVDRNPESSFLEEIEAAEENFFEADEDTYVAFGDSIQRVSEMVAAGLLDSAIVTVTTPFGRACLTIQPVP
jgi:hypothetical protein